MIVNKKIKALRDFNLDTTLDSRMLVAGEVTVMKFKNPAQFADLLNLGYFVEAGEEPVQRVLPVVGEKPAGPVGPVRVDIEDKSREFTK
jgi:hypothetical protein